MGGKAKLYEQIESLQKERDEAHAILARLADAQRNVTRWHRARLDTDLSAYRGGTASSGEAQSEATTDAQAEASPS